MFYDKIVRTYFALISYVPNLIHLLMTFKIACKTHVITPHIRNLRLTLLALNRFHYKFYCENDSNFVEKCIIMQITIDDKL